MNTAHRQQAIARQRDVMDGCLAVYEAFRRFGFKPEEIFFDTRLAMMADGSPPPKDTGVIGVNGVLACVGMTLRAQGKEFKTNCGLRCDPMFLSDDEILSLWEHHAAKWNTGMTPQRRLEIWHSKMPPELLLSLALSLNRTGFVFPNQAFQSQFPPSV